MKALDQSGPVQACSQAVSSPRRANSMTTRSGSPASLPPQSQAAGASAPMSPRRRDRLGSPAMPVMNSSENWAIAVSGTPSRRRPLLVKAICSATSGGGVMVTAVVTGAWRSQERAAAASATSRSK